MIPTHQETKIFHPAGEITVSEREMADHLSLERRLIACRFSELIESGFLLSEIRKGQTFLCFLETGVRATPDGNYVVAHTEEVGFLKYCRDRLKMSKNDVYRRLRIYEHLYLNFPQVFEGWVEEDGVLPDVKRLDFLALRDRWRHPEARRLLESAKVLDSREWEAEKAQLLDGLDEHSAQDKAEEIVLQRIEKMRAKSTTGGTRWSSHYFRKWVATQACVVTGKSKFGEIHAAHVRSRGAGGDDFLNVIPLHHEVHRIQHDQGWDKVLEKYSVTQSELLQKAADVLKTWLTQCDDWLRQETAHQERGDNIQRQGMSR